MRFGLGVPTGTEGLMYPVPYADIDDAVELAVQAESLGFDSIWGNDHVTTQGYVRQEFDTPPRYYDPFSYLSYVAAITSRIRLATAIMVLPFRNPVVAAKQAATLDRLSGGRAVLGVGIGAYREEYEAMNPGHRIHRGEHAAEAIQALNALFTERRASFKGDWVAFEDVESYPKPVQPMLPILSGGNAPGSRTRAALYAGGWLPACLTPEEVAKGIGDIKAQAAAAGRELPDRFEVALQLAVCVAPTHEEAWRKFRSSQLYNHMVSLSGTTLKDQGVSDLAARNLIGTPDSVAEQVAAYQEAGVDTLAGLLFAANTVEETLVGMHEFSETVIARNGGAQQ
ncbi:TIGR03619 family F420-dependent LLM class oxidoreductase [Streptosporangium sp. NBC_01639]|uniref:LLM class flavin-dependent oxidoreductase n=1 Tax=unclassified Streptosporangium TaxID=2632669 RepID=UPI002DD87E6F|nr:TIGR03619 family F420-dependent LLM class oxidoreductase [Streptosporangium sp. NBC_01756]WSC85232.1 TIGR03619 family F420-dependent LLM class oxidoreductase [Streptosporangium sp. NBC_01756]WTD56143.1 TIGR03619 family F420-dependent LLM class oxidoreductase [Streptosporangium sp. NBC_01639]